MTVPAALKDRGGCPLCQSTASDVHMAFKDTPVVKCTRCGFLYSAKIRVEEELLDSYAATTDTLRQRRGQGINARNNAWVIQQFLDVSKLDGVLDVGTGFGFLLDRLRQSGAQRLVGVELSKIDVRYARETLGLNVIEGYLADSGLPKASFDLVTAFEVIEHVPSPVDFLAELAEYVRPGGHLLVMTDNFDSRVARKLGAGLPKWIPLVHISHFSPATLRQAIAKVAGLSIERELHYQTWEVLARYWYYRLRGIRRTAEDAYGTDTGPGGTSHAPYRFYWVRRACNRLWLQLTCSASGEDGDVMYFLLKKQAT